MNDDYLPAEGETKVQPYIPGSRSATAWYSTDSEAARAVLALGRLLPSACAGRAIG